MNYSHDKGYRAEHALEALYRQRFNVDCYRPRAGRQDDVGDLCGVPWVSSVKDHARLSLAAWVDDLVLMVERSPWAHGAVWHKRAGRADPLNWYVTMPGKLYLPVMEEYYALRQGTVRAVSPPFGDSVPEDIRRAMRSL